jgi:hypothetical protein
LESSEGGLEKLGGPVEFEIVLVSTEDRAAGLNIGEIVGGQCSLLSKEAVFERF